MKAESEFAAYLTGDRPSCEAAYLNSRLFPAINALAKKARRCARTQLWLTVGECIAALCLPLLALFPFAIPNAALKLALASLGSYWETALPLSFCALMMFAALILTLRHTQREENVI